MALTDALSAWLAGVDPALRPAIDRLRSIVRDAAEGDLAEDLKWNAPNFADRGADLFTLNLGPRGSLRLIIHRGAKPKEGTTFDFDDPAGLAAWPAPDRGVVSFRDATDVDSKAEALADLVRRWLVACR